MIRLDDVVVGNFGIPTRSNVLIVVGLVVIHSVCLLIISFVYRVDLCEGLAGLWVVMIVLAGVLIFIVIEVVRGWRVEDSLYFVVELRVAFILAIFQVATTLIIPQGNHHHSHGSL